MDEIADYCDAHGIEELAISEHVRKKVSYDFEQLLSDIRQANERFRVRILTGIEAKILPDGTLDCPEEIKRKVDIVIGSVHDLGGMSQSKACETLAESDCMIIGHPQFFNEKIIDSLVRTGKIVELSNRYEQSEEMITAFRDAGLLFSIGLDSHRLEEFADFEELPELIERLRLEKHLWRFNKTAIV